MNILQQTNEHLEAQNRILGQANGHMQNKFVGWEEAQRYKEFYIQFTQMIINTLGLTKTTASKEGQQPLPLPPLSTTSSSNHTSDGIANFSWIDVDDMGNQIKNQQKNKEQISTQNGKLKERIDKLESIATKVTEELHVKQNYRKPIEIK